MGEKKKDNFKEQQEKMISDIEYPYIECRVKDYLDPRGIVYRLEHWPTSIALVVQIVDDIWMEKTVSCQELDNLLGRIPYLIDRPDCIKQDGLGFRVIRRSRW